MWSGNNVLKKNYVGTNVAPHRGDSGIDLISIPMQCFQHPINQVAKIK